MHKVAYYNAGKQVSGSFVSLTILTFCQKYTILQASWNGNTALLASANGACTIVLVRLV